MINELSVIIPTLNEEHYLPRLLNSIVSQSFEGDLEIIVVDGGSKDKTVALANGFKKKIKQLTAITTAKGISHQRNIGAQKAKHKYLMFLDADTYLPKNFLSRITKRLNPTENFVALPLILPIDGNLIDLFYVFLAYVVIFILSFFKPTLGGMCFITNKENHEKIHGFNEKAIYAEDIDYGFRSVKAHAKYQLYLDIYLYASIRRRKQIGRTKLCLIWFKWYLDTIKGVITDASKYKYAFGNH
jgi:glycosyltransferase involved in cell wall biosynthesis